MDTHRIIIWYQEDNLVHYGGALFRVVVARRYSHKNLKFDQWDGHFGETQLYNKCVVYGVLS